MDGARVMKGTFVCPLHGARFTLTTGESVGNVKYNPLTPYDVRIVDGLVQIALPK